MRRRATIGSVLLLLAVAAGACNEEGPVRVHSLNFEGVKAVDTSALRAALATRQGSKLPWGRKAYFDRPRFDADLQRIQAFYTDRGYPDARVTSFDVKLNSKRDAVDVTLTISEGEPVKVAALQFVGFDAVPPAHLATMKNQVPLKVGAPRDRQIVVSSRELALNELRDHGFPYAQVDVAEDDGANGKMATLTFTARQGKLAHFGPVQIEGNRSVSDRTIERELTFKPGALYQRSLVQESQRRLYGMELFQFANIEPIDPDAQPDLVATRVTVAEGKHQRVNFGVGYGTDEKARADAEYHHVNFLGGARSAGIHGRWSSLDKGLRLDFNQPYFFAPRLSLGGEGQQWYTVTPAYNSIVSGGKVTLTHGAGQRSSWAVSITSEHDVSAIESSVLSDLKLRDDLIALGLDPRTDRQSGTLNALGFDFQRSTADNILNARRGYQLAFHAEQAGGILPGTFNYSSMSADGRYYVPLSDKLVLASRLQIGSLRPLSDDPSNVPFSKKYFLGGATSVRGWGRYELAPLSESGLPIGGNSMLSFSEEIRAAAAGSFGVVLFLDAGNVWAGAFGQRLDDLRYAVGPGLRYQTPVGPIRLDVGYQLNPLPNLIVDGSPQSRRWRLHFSIGQAF